MKIINQTEEQLILQEGDASAIIFGIILVVVGAAVVFYTHFSGSVATWVAVAFLVVGIVLVFTSSAITLIANKTTNQIMYQKKRLIGGSHATYAIADILRIETRKEWRTENVTRSGSGVSMPRQVLMSQSVIVFKDGNEVPLDHEKSSSGMPIGSGVLMGGQGKEVAVAMQVANFLGVPFQEIAPPNSAIGMNIGGPGGGIQL